MEIGKIAIIQKESSIVLNLDHTCGSQLIKNYKERFKE